MSTKICKWYDYTQEPVLEEQRKWRILDEEIFESLKKYSAEYAVEEEVDTVQFGDSVRCLTKSNNPKYNDRVMLFYPGRNLCEENLENACVGKKLKDTYTATLKESELTMTIDKIVRRSSRKIDNALIQILNIENVESVEQYYAWYKETNEPNRKMMAAYQLAYYLLEKMAEKSELEIDENEKHQWTYNRAKMIYDAMLKSGMDPKIPKEGFVFLTEEEAIENIRVSFEPLFAPYITSYLYLLENAEKSMEEIINRGMRKLAESVHISVEELEKQSDAQYLRERIFIETTLEYLLPYAETCLEE